MHCLSAIMRCMMFFDHMNGYAYESEVQGVLRGLGFSEEDFSKTMDMLSGGQKPVYLSEDSLF